MTPAEKLNEQLLDDDLDFDKFVDVEGGIGVVFNRIQTAGLPKTAVIADVAEEDITIVDG